MPPSADIPINMNTPYRTAIGMTAKIFVKKTLKPIKIDIIRVETRCSQTPMNLGRSPGAVFSDISLSELICARAKTVAATNHGRPSIEQRPIETPITNKSK